MCGLTGFFADRLPEAPDAILATMTGTLEHRGPDGNGTWEDFSCGIGLGHTRLSIIDISAAGGQPMESHCRRMVVAYNGEIYNATELREELAAAGRGPFRGHSDTEVLAEACAQWGVQAATERLIGMFAFAAWDREARTLTLVRDRLGIKPLYWGRVPNAILFGSELKPFMAYPGADLTIDRDSLTAYMALGHVPTPRSIYSGIYKLEPGTLLTLRQGKEPEPKRYWDLKKIATEGTIRPRDISDNDAVAEAAGLIGDSIRRRMVSDVPLGAFLSGGIDSSTVVGLMQAQNAGTVRTFSIGFDDPAYDEAPHAAAVAHHLGTDHTELYVGPGDIRDLIPRLPEIYDEPFADSSQIPTCMVSEMTRKHVTVALSGDGGDEVFAGYNRYIMGQAVRQQTRHWPAALRKSLAWSLAVVPPGAWDLISECIPSARRPSHPGLKLHKLASILTADSDAEFYRRMVLYWPYPERIVQGGTAAAQPAWDDKTMSAILGFIERMQLTDSLTVLPDDMLTKVDRASMAVGLEVRVPLLDHRVVEMAWSLPPRMRVRDGRGKWLLRRILEQHVPMTLTDRAKTGFSLPIGDWLRGPLRDWAEDLLSPSALSADGLLNPEPIQAAWQTHLKGHQNLTNRLWTVLMFQAWHRRWT